MFWLSVQELLLFITLTDFQNLKTSEGNGLCFSKINNVAHFFPPEHKILYMLNWYIAGCIVVASSPSLLPRAISGKSRNVLQGKACQNTDLLSGSLRLRYFSAFILNKFGERK